MLVRLTTLALAASFIGSPLPVNALSAADIPADTPISSLLSSAQAHVAKGETSEALVYYDAALVRDSSDYLTYFKRATTLLTLGRLNQATEDFTKVVTLKPGFESAHVQLGRIRLRGADWDGAQEQYKLGKRGKGSAESDELIAAKTAASTAEKAAQNNNWEECVNQADVAIAAASRAVNLRELRARCRFAQGDMQGAMGDLQHVLQMKPGDVSPHVKISAISFFALGDLQNGITKIRKCFHSDPESKACKKVLKDEKAIDKTLARVEEAFRRKTPLLGTNMLVPSKDGDGLLKLVEDQVKTFRADGTIPETAPNLLIQRIYEMICEGYMTMGSKKAKDYCPTALQNDENSFYGLWHQGKTALDAEDFEGAVRDLRKAAERHQDKHEQIGKILQEAELQLKRSKTKDYYKVIGVSRDADERQIKAAYRRLSKLHHPDKAVKQGLTKEAAEKKMAQINEAYEVLSNEELRTRFDNGDDPNSNEPQAQQFPGGHPFPFGRGGNGGNPFMNFQQSGGQQFHFHH